jgi:hypothetical protein
MKRPGVRHYTEEELLMHFLQEETADMGLEISAHLKECGECDSVLQEYADLVTRIRDWAVPEQPAEVWQTCRAAVLTQYRNDQSAGRGMGIVKTVRQSLATAWNFALENPLPTLGYIAVTLAFALERTISTFRLDRILPGANDVLELLKQVF